MAAFVERHRQFVEHRVQALQDVPARRMGRLLPLELSSADRVLLESATALVQDGWRVVVQVPGPGPLADALAAAGALSACSPAQSELASTQGDAGAETVA